MRKFSLVNVKAKAGNDWDAIKSLMDLCKDNHPKGMATNAGCACGSSRGGGQPCQGLSILLEAFMNDKPNKDNFGDFEQ